MTDYRDVTQTVSLHGEGDEHPSQTDSLGYGKLLT